MERAELAVLRGVHPTLWPRIQQVTMEVRKRYAKQSVTHRCVDESTRTLHQPSYLNVGNISLVLGLLHIPTVHVTEMGVGTIAQHVELFHSTRESVSKLVSSVCVGGAVAGARLAIREACRDPCTAPGPSCFQTCHCRAIGVLERHYAVEHMGHQVRPHPSFPSPYPWLPSLCIDTMRAEAPSTISAAIAHSKLGL